MKYQLTSEQISSKVAGETVILNHSKGAYYGLDEVGVLIWETLEKGPQTIEALCDVVIGEYDVDADTCKRDIEGLLKDLISERLVEIIK
ncbi:esterase/lipase superfamily enzyme [Dyadobacter sp. BE34]|uniref:Esterase/lipase superfamily enzyme n=1 Tax=Dyadobacter fermentans TaxID=94254 RepID=A0ABU1QUQ6_9BACT|nr:MULTISPECIES: PqqD family protein [Dyadobacter]MDR6804040.1 esterase/lipase superfamily enzyme [Dyadobacter fermentans]MDR7041780.1 esterase/lipase superfamily enzyme [Dyadobacter sp. BE242]MDR7196183.1 esterase/lipase superfamily enzyme [Dyadobacter sp. BE34]MDR7213272.1 esterase/lipase superfamily enzyme [Dyadobacter sp. BE31]MDR7261589.1 esterase/lipase superfamily enzyme [Dyadobacter sp. BE32]